MAKSNIRQYTMKDYEKGLCDIDGRPLKQGATMENAKAETEAPKETTPETPEQETPSEDKTEDGGSDGSESK